MSSSSREVILTSSPDGPILAYEASTGAAVARFTGSRSPRRGLTLAGQGFIAASHVFSNTAAGSIHLYNWYTSTVFHSFPVPEPVAPLTATSDGAYLFAGGLSGSIHSLSLPSGDIIKSFLAHSKPISTLQLSDDGSLVISGSDDGTIVVIPTFRLVDASSAIEDPKDLVLHRWEAHSGSVTAFNSGIGLCNSTLVSCALDCTCKFWSLASGVLIRTVAFPCAILGVAIDSTESDFYAAGADGVVYKGSMKVGNRKLLGKAHELIAWSKSHSGSIESLVLVNDGRNLVSAAEDGSVWMWDVERGEVTMVLRNDMGSISDMIVASSRECGVRGSNNGAGDQASDFTSGLCDEEMVRTLKQISELGGILNVVVEDRKRAIDMLESAIAMYERLLELILKEAMKGTNSCTGEEDEEKEEDKEEDEMESRKEGKEEEKNKE